MENILIVEDFEREAQKDVIYLQETEMLMEQEINRQPAKIIIIDNTNNILQENYEIEHHPLPF